MANKKNNRRRGDDLFEELFEATMDLMQNTKPTNITFKQIADAANTSRTVLYRRWPTTFDLLQDIYTYKAKKLFEGDFFDHLQDAGSLRSDFIQLLTVYQSTYTEIGADILNNYYYLRMQDKEDCKEPEIHTLAVKKHLNAVKSILERAEKRGEKIKKVSEVTLMLPFDQIRLENLIRPNTFDSKRIITMVDEVLLPVFTQ